MSQSKTVSVALSPNEMRLVRLLRVRLQLSSNIDVLRRALRLLEATTDRDALGEAYRTASWVTRRSTGEAIRALDHLSAEGLADL